jgi:virulence-associated protein VapD
MTIVQMRRKPNFKGRPSVQRKAKRVYAITFDLDAKLAEQQCGANWRGTCYSKIASVLASHGFTGVQGSVYFGDEDSDPVRCVVAVQELDSRYAWFGRVVRDLRMLRVDENNDLLPALSNRLRLGDEDAA